MMQNRNVAFFDIDGTFFRWSLFLEILEKMFEEKLLKEELALKYFKKLNLWQKREISFEDFIKEAVLIFDNNIEGVSVSAYIDIARSVVENSHRKTYLFTRELIFELKKQNWFLIAISHSTKFAVDLFAKKMGI